MNQADIFHNLKSEDGETISTETDTTVSNFQQHDAETAESLPYGIGWVQYETATGDVYFFNHDTGESQWENPSESHDVPVGSQERDEYSSSDLRVLIPNDDSEIKREIISENLMTPSRQSVSGVSIGSKSSMTTSIIEVPMQSHSTMPSPSSFSATGPFYEYHSPSNFKPTAQASSPYWPQSTFATPSSKHNSANNNDTSNRIHTPIVNIASKTSFSSVSDISDDLPSPDPQSFSHDQDLNSLSGSEFTDRHLRVWNKFFENALKSQVLPKMKKSYSNRITNRKMITDRKVGKESSSPNRTPRSVWPPPMKDSDYQELLEDFFEDSNHLHDKNWISMIMMAAARKGDAISISRLLSLDFDEHMLKLNDEYLRSPAHYCAKNDDAHCLAILYDSGIDCEATDLDGRAPIHVCGLFGSFDALKFLLQSAVQVNIQDNNRNTALHLAARGGFVKLCRLLLEYEALPALTNDQGQTAYMLAQTVNPRTEAIEEVLRLLIDISPTPKLSVPDDHNNAKISHRKPTSTAISSSSSEEEELAVNRRRGKQPVRFQVDPSSNSDRNRLLRASYDYEEDIASQTSDRDRSSRAHQRLKDAMIAAKHDLNTNNHNQPKRKSERIISSPLPAPVAKSTSSPPPWFDLKVDTSLGKPSPDISASQKSILHSSSPIKHLPLPKLDGESYAESISSSSEDEDDAEPRGGFGLMDKLSTAVWGLTDTLLGITLSMFQDPVSKPNQKSSSSKSLDGRSDSDMSAELNKKSLSELSLEDRPMPPTDKELSVLGLGFHPKPPDFVAAELQAGVNAIRTGRTPIREYPIQAPPEVERLVNSLREEADQISSSNNVIDIQDVALNPFLLTPKARHHSSDFQREHLPKPLFISYTGADASKETTKSATGHRSPKKNAYSVGNRLPDGVAWRYVDVMKNSEYMNQYH